MAEYCEDCGRRVYHGDCVNGCEEAFIEDQVKQTELEEVYPMEQPDIHPKSTSNVVNKTGEKQ